MDIKTLICERRSVHYYDADKELSKEQIKELFELAVLSPSSFNLQPWEFIVIKDKENKKKLKEICMGQQHVEDASAAVIVLAKLNPGEDVEDIMNEWIAKGYFPQELASQYIPVIKAKDNDLPNTKIWAAKNASLAAMTLMIAAKGLGIASCPMEGFNYQQLVAEYKIPQNLMPIMIITLGYENKLPLPRCYRKPVEKILHWEKY